MQAIAVSNNFTILAHSHNCSRYFRRYPP